MDFWDIFGPIFYVLFIANIGLYLFIFIKKSILLSIFSIVYSLFVCYISMWSIGTYLLIVPAFQLFYLIVYYSAYFVVNKTKMH